MSGTVSGVPLTGCGVAARFFLVPEDEETDGRSDDDGDDGSGNGDGDGCTDGEGGGSEEHPPCWRP